MRAPVASKIALRVYSEVTLPFNPRLILRVYFAKMWLPL
jgi:hypothetical protein